MKVTFYLSSTHCGIIDICPCTLEHHCLSPLSIGKPMKNHTNRCDSYTEKLSYNAGTPLVFVGPTNTMQIFLSHNECAVIQFVRLKTCGLQNFTSMLHTGFKISLAFIPRGSPDLFYRIKGVLHQSVNTKSCCKYCMFKCGFSNILFPSVYSTGIIQNKTSKTIFFKVYSGVYWMMIDLREPINAKNWIEVFMMLMKRGHNDSQTISTLPSPELVSKF